MIWSGGFDVDEYEAVWGNGTSSTHIHDKAEKCNAGQVNNNNNNVAPSTVALGAAQTICVPTSI